MAPRSTIWMTSRFAGLAAALLTAATVGCVDRPAESPRVGQRIHPLDAICRVNVVGVGEREVETDYLAHVVACENGAAADEALKAQAVAARSYMYYRVETAGEIGDGQHDQVYSCGRPPLPRHFDAVTATAGEILRYADVNVAAFYVAGSIPEAEDCVARPEDRDPTNTERYVTYNQGRQGDDVVQTPLGWVDRRNLRNRGCQSQNGANCLAQRGWDYRDILRFYYGEDIERVRTVGPCVPGGEPEPEPPEPEPEGQSPEPDPPEPTPEPDMPEPDMPEPDMPEPDMPEPDMPEPDAPSPEPPPTECPRAGPSPAIIDETSSCFAFACQSGDWGVSVDGGFNGQMLIAPTVDADEADCAGWWTLRVDQPGPYTLSAWIDGGERPLSRRASYRVTHAGGDAAFEVDQSAASGWVELGTFEFVPERDFTVWLGDATGEPFSPDGPRLVFDAVQLAPADGTGEPEPPPSVDGGLGDAGVGQDDPEQQRPDDTGCAATPGVSSPASSALAVLLIGLICGRRRRDT